jgi:NTE family protein
MTHRPAPRVGLVLGGGGSKGSFQAGAIAALITDMGLRPDVLAGTSAGSLNAIVLAHARTPDEYPEMVERLLATWSGLRAPSDMYVPRPWLADLTPDLRRSVMEIAAGRPSRKSVADVLGSVRGLPRIVREFRAASDSLYSLAPIEARVRAEVERDRIAAGHADLRLSAVALESGALRWVDAKGAIYEADAVTPAAGGPVDMVDALLASAAFAPAFPPRRMAGETYVDGGFRTVIPVRAARAMGAGPIVAVACANASADLAGSMAEADVFRVTLRAANLTMAEVVWRDIADLGRGPGLLVDPSHEVHGFLEVDPGRIAINIDHGRLVAAERVAAVGGLDRLIASWEPASPSIVDADGFVASAGLTEALTHLRLDTWEAEERLCQGQPKAGAGDTLRAVRARKWLIGLAAAARARCAGPMPPRADAWSRSFEAHRSRVVLRDPWGALSAGNGGHVAAVDPETFVPEPFVLAVRGTGERWLVVDGSRRPMDSDGPETPGLRPTVEAAEVIAQLLPEA